MTMQNNDPYGIRVRLFGHVGSSDASRCSFVLKNPDDRELLVSLSKERRLPPVGVDVSVSGRLRVGEGEETLLEMTSRDRWTVLSRSNANALTH